MAEQNPNGGGGKSDGQLLRCPHCAGPLTKEMETSHWTLSPLLRDSFSMIGSGFGGFTAIFYSYLHAPAVLKHPFLKFDYLTHYWNLSILQFAVKLCSAAKGNCVMKEYSLTLTFILYTAAARPVIKRWIKGPMWVQILVGAPPNMIFASVCSGLAGGSFPALAQLASSSYHAFVSSPPPPPPPPPSL